MCPPRSSARSVGPAGARGGRQVVPVGFPGPHEDADQLLLYNLLELLSNFSRTRHGRRDRRHGCHEPSTTQNHELSLSDVVLLLAFGSVHEVDGLGQAFLE